MTLLKAVFISTFVWQAEIFFAPLDRKLHLTCKCRIIHYVWFNDIVTAGRSPVLHCAVGLGLGFATGDFVCKLCCPRVVLLCQWFASSLYDWKNVAQRKMFPKNRAKVWQWSWVLGLYNSEFSPSICKLYSAIISPVGKVFDKIMLE